MSDRIQDHPRYGVVVDCIEAAVTETLAIQETGGWCQYEFPGGLTEEAYDVWRSRLASYFLNHHPPCRALAEADAPDVAIRHIVNRLVLPMIQKLQENYRIRHLIADLILDTGLLQQLSNIRETGRWNHQQPVKLDLRLTDGLPDPTHPDQTEPDPTHLDPTESNPTDPDPTDSDPRHPVPADPAPKEPDPVNPDPTEPKPTHPDPAHRTNRAQRTRIRIRRMPTRRTRTRRILTQLNRTPQKRGRSGHGLGIP